MENKNIKFQPNVPVDVTLAFDQPKTGNGPHGTWYLYGTKPLITGETGFFATELLHNKIQEAGLSEGDKITIIKVSKDNKTFLILNTLKYLLKVFLKIKLILLKKIKDNYLLSRR